MQPCACSAWARCATKQTRTSEGRKAYLFGDNAGDNPLHQVPWLQSPRRVPRGSLRGRVACFGRQAQPHASRAVIHTDHSGNDHLRWTKHRIRSRPLPSLFDGRAPGNKGMPASKCSTGFYQVQTNALPRALFPIRMTLRDKFTQEGRSTLGSGLHHERSRATPCRSGIGRWDPG